MGAPMFQTQAAIPIQGQRIPPPAMFRAHPIQAMPNGQVRQANAMPHGTAEAPALLAAPTSSDADNQKDDERGSTSMTETPEISSMNMTTTASSSEARSDNPKAKPCESS